MTRQTSADGQARLLRYHKAAFLCRSLVALSVLAFHASIFWPEFQWTQWLVILPHTLILPSLIYLFCSTRECERRTILFDAAIFGYYVGLWGFNPLILCIVVCAAIVTSVANGGLTYLRVTLIALASGMISAALLHGLATRPQLSLLSTVIAMLSAFIYLGLLSYVFFIISDRLKKAKRRSKEQHEELVHINNITNAASATLNLNGVMKGLMQVLQKLYPLESVFILAYDTHKTGLEILGCYSEELTELEKSAYAQFTFDLARDHDSLYVKGMEQNQILYLQTIREEYVRQGCQVDQELYAIRPTKSVAFFPIAIRGKVIAGVVFANYVHYMKLRPRDLDKIQSYLLQIGTAIRNVRMYYDVRKTRDLAKRARNQAEVAKRKAEESEDAKSHFLANMSHEIRTPMTAILGYSEALSDPETSEEERKEYTETIIRSGKHLLSIINDILDISKIEASKIEVEDIEVNFVQLLSEVESYARIKVKEKGLDFTLTLGYPLPVYIKTDPTRLKQILFNLINNAVKFTEKGRVGLEVTTSESAQLQFVVMDTGIGLTAAEQKKLFKPFSQSDASVTRVYGGTGLGLYISQSLARLLGGDISLHSKKGEGSHFTVTINLDALDDDVITSEKERLELLEKTKQSDKEGGVPQLSGRALIAEDNPENQQLIKRLVARTGLDVTLVENGREAVLNASYQKYQIILLDMQMPLMGGREAAKRMRELGIEAPIIAFTANVMKHQIQEYKTLGFNSVIEKPINQDKLYAVLREFVREENTLTAHGRVLLVEDNTVNQMVLKRMVLKAHDQLEITIANHGQEAVDLAADNEFDLVLMDMEMPVMDGLTATRALRERGFSAPIVIVTGNIDPAHVRQCLDAGADGHLAKPIDNQALQSLLDRSFKKT